MCKRPWHRNPTRGLCWQHWTDLRNTCRSKNASYTWRRCSWHVYCTGSNRRCSCGNTSIGDFLYLQHGCRHIRPAINTRSEERRVGKECRAGETPSQEKKQEQQDV